MSDGIITANAKLTELDLSDNAFGPDGVKACVRLLTSCACYSLTTLKLNNNGLGIGGGKVGITLLACLKRLLERGSSAYHYGKFCQNWLAGQLVHKHNMPVMWS